MTNLIDFLTFKTKSAPDVTVREPAPDAGKLRLDERDAAVLAGKYPHDGADIETVSEYRLASLMQYPHY